MHKTDTSSYINTIAALALTKVASLVKLSFIVGSYHTLLSASGMALPLVGVFGGITGSTLVCAAHLALRYCMFGINSASILAFYIPGWSASLYMASSHWLIRVAIPLSCIAAFIAHPVGGSAWIYTSYWLIPIAIYFTQRTSIFYQALGATFTAHAVGSVIWMYTVEMSAQAWLGLIPIVAVERLAYTAGMVVLYHGIIALSALGSHLCRSTAHRIS